MNEFQFNSSFPPWPESRWLTIYSKPRAEFFVSNGLEQRGYASLLPVCQRQVKQRGEKPPPILPLFPRYLFVNLLEGVSWYPILSVPGVTTLLSFGQDQPVVVPEAVINELVQRLIAEDGVIIIKPEPDELKAGQRCMITAGPLINRTGLFVGSVGGRTKLLLEILGRSSLTVVPNGVVIPLPDSKQAVA